jgi:hypothetical protein
MVPTLERTLVHLSQSLLYSLFLHWRTLVVIWLLTYEFWIPISSLKKSHSKEGLYLIYIYVTEVHCSAQACTYCKYDCFNTSQILLLYNHNYTLEDSKEYWIWRMASSGMLHSVALVRTDVSVELSASFTRVTRIGELGTRNNYQPTHTACVD